jgi:serine/threonine protein kinase/Tfp pilus assembly protein PilF
MSFAPGSRLGHHEIIKTLGVGGMGEVYCALDTALGRHVALKVLPRTLANDPARIDRFRREARIVAALNHPHIVTIYSVEQDAATGTHFLTMELIDGTSLDRTLPAEGLATARLLDVAWSLADALAAAHDKGIVHRDLKPANTMVTSDGRVKVLDFGLAKAADAPDDATSDADTTLRTGEGIVLGTAPYMSPEQVEGRPLDARSDLFSLGVVLHEAATGVRPFQGASQAALLSSILRDPAPALRARREDLPEAFERLVARCLEKDRDRRIQTAKDVRNEIDAIRAAISASAVASSGPVSVGPRSIIVLPFVNLSPDADNAYFSDGLTEELIADLAMVKALSVISRTSSMQLKGTAKNVREIGAELGVQYVLEGSVRKAGNSLRITAQLVDVATDAPLWSNKYSGTMDDVFEVQERVSKEIVKALGVRLTSDEQRRLVAREIADPRAFELYLLARHELRRYAIPRALTLVDEAIRFEGETPPLRAVRAWATLWQVRLGMAQDQGPLEEAERTARALLAERPDAAYGHALLGHLQYERGHLLTAVRSFEQAIALEPNDSDVLVMLTFTLQAGGQDEAAQSMALRLMQCDPLSPASWMAAGGPQWFVGRVDRAISDMQRGLEIDPQSFILHWCIGYAYALAGKLPEATLHGAELDRMHPGVPYTRQLLSLLAGIRGRREEALSLLAPINLDVLDAHQRFHLAESFIAAGALDRGLDLLEQSSEGFHPYGYMAHHCRFLDPVRGMARFDAVLNQARIRTEAFRAAVSGR